MAGRNVRPGQGLVDKIENEQTISIFRNVGYDGQISVDEVRVIDSLFKLRLMDASESAEQATRGPASKNRASDARRNEMAVNPLKSHNPAKWPDFEYNDFNDLRPPTRNVSFRLAKYAFRLAGFLTRGEPNVSPGASDNNSRGRPAAERSRSNFVSAPSRRAPVFQRAVSAALAGVGTISRLSKLGHWRLCGDDQGVKKLRNSQPPRASRRREAASKDASGAANEAMSWTILRDAKLRSAPQDEAGGWRSRC